MCLMAYISGVYGSNGMCPWGLMFLVEVGGGGLGLQPISLTLISCSLHCDVKCIG